MTISSLSMSFTGSSSNPTSLVSVGDLVRVGARVSEFRPANTSLTITELVGPLTIIGCVGLYFALPFDAKIVLPLWGGIGLVLYFAYGYRKSHVGRGIIEVHEADADVPPQPVPPMPGAPAPGSKQA